MEEKQDTGNPVLDSFVNIVVSFDKKLGKRDYEEFHDTIRELALKEPGGLKRRTGDGRLEEFNEDDSPSVGSL